MDTVSKKTKSSWYIPQSYVDALRAVYRHKRVMQSHQVELALKGYMEEHRDLLKEEGIDLWK